MSSNEFVLVGKCSAITERKPAYVDLPANTKGYLTEKVEHALKTPFKVLRKLPSGKVAESWAKQIVVSATIHRDEKDADYRWRYKAEVSFDMSPVQFDDDAAPIPFLSSNRALLDKDGANRRHSRNPFPPGFTPGFLRRPDVIIVRDSSTRWPGRGNRDRNGATHADNLLRLVEIKFPGDDWNEGQEAAYQQIAGGKHRMSVLDVSDCNGDLEEAKRRSAAADPADAPVIAPTPPSNSGDNATGGIPVRVPARSIKPITEKVWYEPWLNEMDDVRTHVARAVASLWDDTRQGVSTMSAQARDWVWTHAPWLMEAGRWVRDTGSQTWRWTSANGLLIYNYTDAQLRAMWAMVQEATDLTWDQLQTIVWGQVVTLVKSLNKGVVIVVAVVASTVVTLAVVGVVFAALAALVALVGAATAAGATALAMLAAAVSVTFAAS